MRGKAAEHRPQTDTSNSGGGVSGKGGALDLLHRAHRGVNKQSELVEIGFMGYVYITFVLQLYLKLMLRRRRRRNYSVLPGNLF